MSKPTLIFIILIAVFIIGFFLLWPGYQDFKENQRTIDEKRAELQYKEEYFSNLEETAQELTKYKEELTKIDSALPSDPSLPSLFDFLQKTSSQNGLLVENLSASSTANSSSAELGAIKETTLNLRVSGSYPSFKNFLSSLEKTSRIIEVESVSLSSPTEKAGPFSFDLQLKTYSY